MKVPFIRGMLPLLLSGCAGGNLLTLPDVTQDLVDAADVLHAFECELVQTVQGNSVGGDPSGAAAFLNNKIVVATFTLTATQSQSRKSDISVSVPSGLTKITLGTSSTPSRTATRKIDFKLTFDTKALMAPENGDPGRCASTSDGNGSFNEIQGDLGVGDWAASMHKLSGSFLGGLSDPVYEIKFKIDEGLSTAPNIARTNASGSGTSFSFSPSNSKGIEHKIIVSAKAPKAPTSIGGGLSVKSRIKSVEDDLKRNIDSFSDRTTD